MLFISLLLLNIIYINLSMRLGTEISQLPAISLSHVFESKC